MRNLQSPEFLKGLKRLSLISRHKFAGQRLGERKTLRKGHSIEFKDYKEYNPGDDIRFIDWNVWGRLDTYFIKLFYHEENQFVFHLLDLSKSMASGAQSKWDMMMMISAATAYVALAQKDLVMAYPFGADLLTSGPRCSGVGQYAKLVTFLQALRPARESGLLKAGETFLLRERRKGILFILSDFYHEEQELEVLFRKLAFYGFDVNLIQILSQEELQPDFYGLHLLNDMESQRDLELDIQGSLLLAYEQEMEEHQAMVQRLASRFGFSYRMVPSDSDPQQVVVDLLRASARGKVK